jgi:transposase-like protein
MRIKLRTGSRRRFSATERASLLAEYRRSQLTQREFVEQHELSLATLTKWLRQEREHPGTPGPQQFSFAEIPLGSGLGAPRWAAELVYADGRTVRLAGDAPAALVEQLLRPC